METGVLRSFAPLRMTIVQKSFRYSVGRVLAPAADGRSFRNRTACRQTVHMFCTHSDKSICLLRQHSQICQYITAGASTRPTFNPVKPLFYCHLEHSPTITPIPLERNVSIMIKPRTLSGFMELLPAPQQQMERIMDILRDTYSLYGFTPLDTPVIEASRGPAGQGRRRDGEADLPLHQGRQRPGPAL